MFDRILTDEELRLLELPSPKDDGESLILEEAEVAEVADVAVRCAQIENKIINYCANSSENVHFLYLHKPLVG